MNSFQTRCLPYFLSVPVSSLKKSTCPLISTLTSSQAQRLYFFFQIQADSLKLPLHSQVKLPEGTVPPPGPPLCYLQVIQLLIKAMEEFIQEGLITGQKRATHAEAVEDLWGNMGLSTGPFVLAHYRPPVAKEIWRQSLHSEKTEQIFSPFDCEDFWIDRAQRQVRAKRASRAGTAFAGPVGQSHKGHWEGGFL